MSAKTPTMPNRQAHQAHQGSTAHRGATGLARHGALAARPARPAPVSTLVSAAPSDSGRHVRRVSPGSLEALLLLVVRTSMADDWTPANAAREISQRSRADVDLLRRARARLRRVTDERRTLVGARAVATLNVAITRLEMDAG